MTEPIDTSPCPEWVPLLHGLADGELDAEHALRVERHVADHAPCARELALIRQTRQTLKEADLMFRAPDALRDRILASIAVEATAQTTQLPWSILQRIRRWLRPIEPWSLPSAFAVLALSFILVVMPRTGTFYGSPDIEAELVSGHVRSLLAGHLMDIATSDRHTVKPWFNGRIDFSPPVIDLKPQGYPLKGGRVDYIGGRVVAALAFQHNAHIINLFIWPSMAPVSATDERNGYNLIGWTQDGLTFWAISDLNASELKTFKQEFSSASPD
ncbi:anti-sigma factor family protein [Pleomorphomonas oryzae]|uniref:anti-sigma factor family protein n=1 Tax=Pleomorphomonas oryzae TaxID=261934 RepID=UPI0004159D3C|nr:anti-sigma factor [Pleomorphomonas oryzae]